MRFRVPSVFRWHFSAFPRSEVTLFAHWGMEYPPFASGDEAVGNIILAGGIGAENEENGRGRRPHG